MIMAAIWQVQQGGKRALTPGLCPDYNTRMTHKRVTPNPFRRSVLWFAAALAIVICAGLITGCLDKKSGSIWRLSPPLVGAEDFIPPLKKDLPAEVAKELKTLLEKEWNWLVKPPAEFSPPQLDHEFAELRWEVARKFGTYDVEGAISYARASLALDEAHPERWEQLGDLYNLSGDVTGARDAANAYDNAVFLDPGAISPRRKLAAALTLLQQPGEAAIQLEYCLCKVDKQEEQELLPLYASACAASGEFQRGIAFCRERSNTEQGHAYRVIWAIFERAAGNRDEALRLLGETAKDGQASAALAEYARTLKARYETEGAK